MSGRAAWALAVACLLLLAGCQTTDPPEPEKILRLRLNDSLAKFERVEVEVLEYGDTSKLLANLWNGPLPLPASSLPGFSLKNVQENSFIVRVKAYKLLGQLAVQTMIFYENGVKKVTNIRVPPLRPLNYLTSLSPNQGQMVPPFHQDSLKYVITLPLGVSSVNFNAQGSIPGISILAEGQVVASGATTKDFPIGSAGDTLDFVVTDTSTGTAASRSYTVHVIRTLPPGLYLASLAPSVGTFNKPFTPEGTLYELRMPGGVDTLTFLAKPMDTRTMTMVIDGEVVFFPQPSKVIKVPIGDVANVRIIVSRGGESSYYQIFIDNTGL